MQRAIARTERAKTRFAKEKWREDRFRDYQKMKANRKERQEADSYKSETIKIARQRRKDEWGLGPLAPKLNVGPDGAEYGAMSMQQFQGTPVREHQKIKLWPIREDDRVVIVEPGHRDRGKIGKVISRDQESNTLKVEGLNLVRLPCFDNRYHFLADQSSLGPRCRSRRCANSPKRRRSHSIIGSGATTQLSTASGPTHGSRHRSD